MPATKPESRSLISDDVSSPMVASTDARSPVRSRADSDEQNREVWQKLINQTLLAWLDDPSRLEDDGIEPPTMKIIQLAIDQAEQWRDDGLLPPDSIVPDPNGGIVFEQVQGDEREVFYLWDDGTLEYQQFRGTELKKRYTLGE